MIWADEKRRLLGQSIALGTGAKDVPPDNHVPGKFLAQWMKKFYAPAGQMDFPEEPRLVNHYTMGADPEFIFTSFTGSVYSYAETFGLTTLSAFGCDLAGRQAELRLYPSRFALEVVASVTETLRWLGSAHPGCVDLGWHAATFVEGGPHGKDGIGGHLHIGRKKVSLPAQTESLDMVTRLLLGAGVLNKRDFEYRQARTVYGKWGDVRRQTFGYEYRVTPCWLANPWVAYLTLVVNKLCIYHHERIIPIAGKERQQLANLLCMYKGLDDDAAIAWKALGIHGWPQDDNTDFKGRWGVKPSLQTTIYPYKKHYYPSMIRPHAETVKDLFNYLTMNVAIPKKDGKLTWTPFELPKGFYSSTVAAHVKDLPDIPMGLISKDVVLVVNSMDKGLTFWTDCILPKKAILAALRDLVGPAHISFQPLNGKQLIVYVPQNILVSHLKRAAFRAILADTKLFPVCQAKDFARIDWADWNAKKVVEAKTIGREIGHVEGKPVLPVEPMQNPLFQYQVAWMKADGNLQQAEQQPVVRKRKPPLGGLGGIG